MNRGVIAAPAIINIQGNGFTMERGLSPQEISYYALYWDKVVVPTNNLVHVGLPEEDILIDSGVIERPRVQFQGAFHGAEIGQAFAISQYETAKNLIETDRSTEWVIHQIGRQIHIPQKYAELKNSLRFELVNLLPVPNAATPIIDILEFKERRSDELNALHNAIEEVYIEALRCPDLGLGESRAIRDLKAQIGNLDEVTRERWNLISKYDFSVEFNLDGGSFMQGIASGAVIDFFANSHDLPVVAVLGGLASLIRLKASRGSSFKPADNSNKLSFLSYAHSAGIIQNDR